MTEITVRPATTADLPQLAMLFDGYRTFYKQAPDPALAESFLADRMTRGDSVILVAEEQGALLGFTQLYPSFSSMRAKRIFILNDLFVAESARRRGVAGSLLAAAAEHGQREGAARLTLSTAFDNHQAQAVYEKMGWTRDRHFQVYTLAIG